MGLNPKYLLNADEVTLSTVLFIQRNIAELILKHVRQKVPKNLLEEVQESVGEYAGIDLTIEQTSLLLDSFPKVKANVLAFGVRDTETRRLLSSMMSEFLLGVEWPTNGDKMDMDIFLKHLHEQAYKLGYKIVSA